MRFDPDADPLYFTHHPNWEVPELDIVGTGLTFRIQRRGTPVPEPVIPKTELDGEMDPSVPKDYLTQNLIGHFHYMQGVTFERLDWPRAETAFARARHAGPDNDVLFYNLGLIYRRNGLLDRSLASFERSEAINSRHIASSSRVRAADRIGELEDEVERLSRLEAELAEAKPIRGLEPDSAEYHQAMAARLFSRGEPIAARGRAACRRRRNLSNPEVDRLGCLTADCRRQSFWLARSYAWATSVRSRRSCSRRRDQPLLSSRPLLQGDSMTNGQHPDLQNS